MSFKRCSFFIISILLFCFSFSSCRLKKDYLRLYLNDKLYYLSASPEKTVYDVSQCSDFKKLSKQDSLNLAKLLDNENDFLWIRINFNVPGFLKNENLGLFVSQLQSASEMWLNGYPVGGYGSMPPKPFAYGYSAQFYSFPQELLNQDSENTIYIKVWPGIVGTIAEFIYIGTAKDAEIMCNLATFTNSKIHIFFLGILVFNFLFYLGIFLILRRYLGKQDYLDFSLLNLSTAGFILPFCVSDFSKVFPEIIPFMEFVKFSYIFCVFATIFFLSDFILHSLDYKMPRGVRLIKNMLAIVSCISVMYIRDYKNIFKIGGIFLILMMMIFIYSFVILNRNLIHKQTRKKALRLIIGFTPVLAMMFLDWFTKVVLKLTAFPFFTVYGWILTILFFTVQLIRRMYRVFAQNFSMQQELSTLNLNLEEQIKQRTLELFSTTAELDETNKKLTRNIDILNYDLETAKIVQEDFMPPARKNFIGWDVAVYYKPLEHVSGDMFDYYSTDNVLNGFSLFDVSGHGTSAALITMLSKSIIYRDFIAGKEKTTEEIMLDINRNIIGVKGSTERYLTGLLMRFSKFDASDRCYVELSNAGHPFPVLYSAEKKTFTEIEFADSRKQFGFIGLDDEQVAFPPSIFSMGIDDVLVFFTDGLTQAENSKGKVFGTQILGASLLASKDKSAKKLLDDIVDLLKHFTAEKPVSDDITIVVLKRTKTEDFIEEI